MLEVFVYSKKARDVLLRVGKEMWSSAKLTNGMLELLEIAVRGALYEVDLIHLVNVVEVTDLIMGRAKGSMPMLKPKTEKRSTCPNDELMFMCPMV